MSRRRSLLACAAVSSVLVGGLAAVTLPASAVTAGCRVAYTVQSQWPGGFQASVAITNLGDSLSSWTLTWSYSAGQTVTQSWGATATQSGSAVTAVNASYTASLPTNGSESFGFNGTWNGSSNPVPASFSLDGAVCNGTVSSVSPTPQPPSPVLAQVSTVGQTETAGSYVEYTWPGIYFEGRFQGTGVGIVLNDSVNDYDVAIDGTTVAEVVTPGQTTYWINNLTNGVHTGRVRRTRRGPGRGDPGQAGGAHPADRVHR